MADDRIELEIVLDDGKVVQGFARIEKAAEDAGERTGMSLEKGMKFANAAALAAAAAIAAAGYAMFRTLKSGIAEAQQAEDALNSLESAFKVMGEPVAAASARFQDFATQLQNITTVGDDAIIQNASLLVSIGKLRGEGLEKATKAALDLSAGLGKDLGSSFELVAKAASGNTEALGRYGIKIDQNIPKSQQFAVALEKINAAFGGMAESKANTFSGAMAQMSNRFSDLLQSVGEFITKSPAAVAVIKLIGESFLKITKELDKVRQTGDVFGQMLGAVLSFGTNFVNYVLKPIEFLYNTVKIIYNVVTVVVQSIIVAFTAIVTLSTMIMDKVFGALLTGAAKIAGFFNKDLAASITSFREGLTSIPDTMKMVLGATTDTLGQFSDNTVDASKQIFDFKLSEVAQVGVNKLVETVANAKEPLRNAAADAGRALGEGLGAGMSVSAGFSNVLLGLTNELETFKVGAEVRFQQIGKAMLQTLGTSAGQAFAAFGKAIATGKNGIQAFLNSLLASLGQAAVQMGSQFILQGAAYTWAGMPNGPPLIAAGAALATFGGILAGVGGASESGGGVATAGGGAVGGGATSQPQTQEPQKQTQVVVNVQGNILDRRESGMAIAEVLNEYFSANDGRLVTAV